MKHLLQITLPDKSVWYHESACGQKSALRLTADPDRAYVYASAETAKHAIRRFQKDLSLCQRLGVSRFSQETQKLCVLCDGSPITYTILSASIVVGEPIETVTV